MSDLDIPDGPVGGDEDGTLEGQISVDNGDGDGDRDLIRVRTVELDGLDAGPEEEDDEDAEPGEALRAFFNASGVSEATARFMSRDLKTLLEEFETTTDPSERNALTEAILFKWSGSDTVNWE